MYTKSIGDANNSIKLQNQNTVPNLLSDRHRKSSEGATSAEEFSEKIIKDLENAIGQFTKLFLSLWGGNERVRSRKHMS